MRFQQADDNILPSCAQRLRLRPASRKSCRRPPRRRKRCQPAAPRRRFLRFDLGEKLVGVGPCFGMLELSVQLAAREFREPTSVGSLVAPKVARERHLPPVQRKVELEDVDSRLAQQP